MSNQELKVMLDSVAGIPFAYSHFAKGKVPPLPYGVWYEDSDTSVKADGITAFRIPNYIIELYTQKKSPGTVDALLAVLSENDISYDITGEVWLDTEEMYMTTIEID